MDSTQLVDVSRSLETVTKSLKQLKKIKILDTLLAVGPIKLVF